MGKLDICWHIGTEVTEVYRHDSTYANYYRCNVCGDEFPVIGDTNDWKPVMFYRKRKFKMKLRAFWLRLLEAKIRRIERKQKRLGKSKLQCMIFAANHREKLKQNG